MDNKELEEKIKELTQSGTFIVANPKTIQDLKEKGLPFKSTFVSWEEYLDKLFEEKRGIAGEIIGNFPLLSSDLANASVKSLYEEIRECYALGLFGATITLSIIYLELGLKYAVHRKRTENDRNSPWEYIEKMNFTGTVNSLKKLDLISQSEKTELDRFNLEVRNPYIHYNLQKLVQDIVISKLPTLNTGTSEVKIRENVRIADEPPLWFTGKKFLDKEGVDDVLHFCVHWVNNVLG